MLSLTFVKPHILELVMAISSKFLLSRHWNCRSKCSAAPLNKDTPMQVSQYGQRLVEVDAPASPFRPGLEGSEWMDPGQKYASWPEGGCKSCSCVVTSHRSAQASITYFPFCRVTSQASNIQLPRYNVYNPCHIICTTVHACT